MFAPIAVSPGPFPGPGDAFATVTDDMVYFSGNHVGQILRREYGCQCP